MRMTGIAAVLLLILLSLAAAMLAMGVAGTALANFRAHPALLAIPGSAAIAVVGAVVACRDGRPGAGFLWSALALSCVMASLACCTYPMLVPSSIHPDASLTIWNASASARSLQLMLVAAAILLPLIVLYTTWVYRVLRGRISQQTIRERTLTAY